MSSTSRTDIISGDVIVVDEIVVVDAVGDRDPRPHAAAVLDFQVNYADVIPESAAITYLQNLP